MSDKSVESNEKAEVVYHEVAPLQEPSGGLLSAWTRKDHTEFFKEVRYANSYNLPVFF
jgi:hypothetical protein